MDQNGRGQVQGTDKTGRARNSAIDSLITGSISSVVTTIIYQPLELLKTRIQIAKGSSSNTRPVFGRLTKSTFYIVKNQGLTSLWKGTGASLIRSGPGVGFYYGLLNVLQSNFSSDINRPDNATQAFYFGLLSRSMVSFLLLPVTVVKVRYESGHFAYPSLTQALKNAYLSSNGWVGIMPTILRDSLFSGIYYMCYTKLKSDQYQTKSHVMNKQNHLRNFSNGLLSGIVASVITNPIDVMKTHVQVSTNNIGRVTVKQIVIDLLSRPGGYLRFFDGLMPRSIRRTLIAASTWTFYELMIETLNTNR